jgi:hypothetical protein
MSISHGDYQLLSTISIGYEVSEEKVCSDLPVEPEVTHFISKQPLETNYEKI